MLRVTFTGTSTFDGTLNDTYHCEVIFPNHILGIVQDPKHYYSQKEL